MYEHHTERLLPWRDFLRRLARHGGLAGAALLISLVIGIIGFHLLADEQWDDAFLNASMLLSGMGLVGSIERPVGKIFASLYALYAGVVFLGATVLLLTPVIHRVLHKLRMQENRDGK